MSNHKYFNTENKIWSAPESVCYFNPMLSVGEIILSALDKTPDKVTQVFDNGICVAKKTCGNIRAESLCVAEYLKQQGLKFGDIVTVVSYNVQELAAIVFGCLIAGVTINPLNPDCDETDLREVLAVVKPKLVFSDNHKIKLIRDELKCTKIIHINDSEELDQVFGAQNVMQETSIPTDINVTVSSDAFIMCSSKSVKLVRFSHANIISQLLQMFHVREDDVLLSFCTLNTLQGVSTLLTGTVMAATRVITAKPFNAPFQLSLIQKHCVTVVLTNPDHLTDMIDSKEFRSTDLSSIRYIQTMGEAVIKTLREIVEKQLPNGRLIQSYGLMEIAGIATLNYPVAKEYSVGRPVNQCKFKILKNGEEVGPNIHGEILIKTPTKWLGYFSGSKQLTVEQDTWIRTDDLGYFDEDGFLFIVGKIDQNGGSVVTINNN